MELIFKNIKQLMTPQFFTEASDKLAIEETTLIKLSDPILAGLFGNLLTQGDNTETEKILKTFVSDVEDKRRVGIYFLENDTDSSEIEATLTLCDAILLGKRKEFISFLSEQTSVDKLQIEILMTALTYTFGLDLGGKLATNEYTITGILAQIHAERSFFLGYIPLGLTALLNMPSLLAIGSNLSSDAKVASDAIYYEIMHNNTHIPEKKNSWWKWFSLRAAL